MWNLYTKNCEFIFFGYMKKLSLLLVLGLLVLAAFLWLLFKDDKDQTEPDIHEIDVSETDFKYDVAICDKYFGLIECIINNDPNQARNSQMKLELKSKFRELQEEWKQLSENELAKKCTEEYENYKKNLKENQLNSFGCITDN